MDSDTPTIPTEAGDKANHTLASNESANENHKQQTDAPIERQDSSLATNGSVGPVDEISVVSVHRGSQEEPMSQELSEKAELSADNTTRKRNLVKAFGNVANDFQSLATEAAHPITHARTIEMPAAWSEGLSKKSHVETPESMMPKTPKVDGSLVTKTMPAPAIYKDEKTKRHLTSDSPSHHTCSAQNQAPKIVSQNNVGRQDPKSTSVERQHPSISSSSSPTHCSPVNGGSKLLAESLSEHESVHEEQQSITTDESKPAGQLNPPRVPAQRPSKETMLSRSIAPQWESSSEKLGNTLSYASTMAVEPRNAQAKVPPNKICTLYAIQENQEESKIVQGNFANQKHDVRDAGLDVSAAIPSESMPAADSQEGQPEVVNAAIAPMVKPTEDRAVSVTSIARNTAPKEQISNFIGEIDPPPATLVESTEAMALVPEPTTVAAATMAAATKVSLPPAAAPVALGGATTNASLVGASPVAPLVTTTAPGPLVTTTTIAELEATKSTTGIFDDAENDTSFDLSAYEAARGVNEDQDLAALSLSNPVVCTPSVTLPPDTNDEARNKNDAQDESLTPTTAAPMKPPQNSNETQKEEPKKKKKRAAKPMKRVLVTRKEKDAAVRVLKGKDDLVEVLEMGHCEFLGKKFWVFTVQQLECILKATKKSQDATDDASANRVSTAPTESEKYQFREKLLDAVARSHLVASAEMQALQGISGPSAIKQTSTTLTTPQPTVDNGVSKEDGVPRETAAAQSVFVTINKSQAEDNSLTVNASKGKVQKLFSGHSSMDGTSTVTQGGSPNETSDSLDIALPAHSSAGPVASIEVDAQLKKAAENLLDRWQSRIDSWRQSGKSKAVPIEEKFLLSGPVSCLFQTHAQRFLASVPVLTLYDFLCLKKTETGAIIALCKEWRNRCCLVDASLLSLAKTFLGIGSRVETAISAAIPPDETTRKWLSDPIVVLTGAAKEFAIDDRKIYSGLEFVERRTKDLASQLVEWRTRKGLPGLKGSGKVAMISGWKANVKEALDLEQGDGRVLEDLDLQVLAEQEEQAPIAEVEAKKNKSQQPSRQVQLQEFTFDPRIPDVDAALHSTTFLQEALEPKHFSALKEAGVKTADALFSAQKNQGSPLALAVSKILPDPSTFELVIFDWCQIVRKKLSGIRRVSSKRKDPPNPTPVSEVLVPKVKKEKPSEPRPSVAKPTKKDLIEKDAFCSLSSVTQDFLSSLGITTAEAFMTSRTTDLSSAFVEYREKHGMSVLKGLGAIASVSGWKAQIRKIAKERGMEELANMAPPGAPNVNTGPITNRKQKTKPKIDMGSSLDLKPLVASSKARVTRPDILFGKATHRVVVESTRDPRLRFFFELAMRRKPNSEVAMFVTYQGAKQLQSLSNNTFWTPLRHIEVSGGITLPVVKDVSKVVKRGLRATSTPGKDVKLPFSSLEEGGGVIEFGRHNTSPLPFRGESSIVLPAIKAFITETNQSIEEIPAATNSYSSNVLVGKDHNGNPQYFLFLKEFLEPGQTLEVSFCCPPGKDDECLQVEANGQWRSFIDGTILRLSEEGLLSLLHEVSRIVSELDSKLWNIDDEGSLEALVDPKEPAKELTEFEKLVVSKRRAHWVACRIVARLEDLQIKDGASGSPDMDNLTKDTIGRYEKIWWTPELASKLKEHKHWTESLIAITRKEIEDELECVIDFHPFLNAANSRKRWCAVAAELFHEVVQIVPLFSTLLDDDFSSQQAITEIREMVSKMAAHLVSLKTKSSKDIGGFLLTFEDHRADKWDTFRESTPNPGYRFQSEVVQSYHDALCLCGESRYEVPLPEPGERQRIATVALPLHPKSDIEPESGSTTRQLVQPTEALFRTAADVNNGQTDIHIEWYARFQVLLPLQSLFSSLAECGTDSFRDAAMKPIETALVDAGIPADSWIGETKFSALGGSPIVYPCHLESSVYEPDSLPLFLGLIWPILRKAHWKIDAGDTPLDVSFLPPGERGRRNTKGDKRSRVQKNERAKTRNKAAKATSDIGLGFVPKLSKRLFVNCTERKAIPLQTVRESNVIATVSEALTRFVAKVLDDVADDDALLQRAESVASYIRICFDDLFPSFLNNDEARAEYEQLAEGIRPSDTAGCEYLARFLLVVPNVLSQAGLTADVVDDTTVVLRELGSFLTQNHKELFDARFHPPAETYADGERTVPAVFASRLESTRAGEETSDSALNSVVLTEEDKLDLTDFAACVLGQLVPCRATKEDVEKRRQHLTVGRVGLLCKHCMGSRGAGRSFFANVESLNTAAGTIEKHILKCPDVPIEVKTEMAEARRRHSEQRKNLAQGSQASYFLRLWERLRMTKVRNPATTLQILEMKEKEENEQDEVVISGGFEFESHAKIVNYCQKTLPWKDKPNLLEAINEYYGALEYASRLHACDTKPKKFSSELALAQVKEWERKQEEAATPTEHT